MLIPVHVTNVAEVTLHSQLWFPLSGLRITLPLVHRAAISVGKDLVNIVKEHSAKEGMLVTNHGT